MDLLSFFDGSKPVKRIDQPLRSHRICNPVGMSALDIKLNHGAASVVSTGTKYAEEYVKEDERRVLAEANPLVMIQGKNGNDFEEISLGTMPVHHDLNNVELTKIYKTYDFAFRPKDNLTITAMKEKIVSMIQTNPVTIIQGPTGCGKTTQVPQFILDSCYKKRVHCNIIVTQPRRIAAISIAQRVSAERSWPCGSLVGYQVGMVNTTSRDTRLTYCTTGVLLHKLINTKNMLDYTHVIIDEVHERDQEMDFLLLVVRKLLRSNSRSVKVILMSATINVNKFSKYFSVPIGNVLKPAPIVDVTKSNFFKVQVFYLCQIVTAGLQPEVFADNPTVSSDMMQFCIHILYFFNKVDEDTGNRYSVLVFLPGIWEIEEMHRRLTSEEQESMLWDVVVLHSSITNEEQQLIFEKPPNGYRRIILATNIAESSLTVPDIKYVIDFCLTKQLITDPKTNFQCLELGWASKANCEQRAGRTGRLMDGRVYRLVPEYFYNSVFADEAEPEMTRAPLENVVLNAKILDMGEPKAILALSLDPPDLSNLERTILLLKETGALLNKKDEEISPVDGELTDLGRIMAALPVDIHISKLIALGHVFSVFREATIIGASMAVKNMFSAPFQKKLAAYAAKLAWSENSCSDCISFLNVYNVWMHDKAERRIRNDAAEKQWARSRFVQIRVLREVEALVHELMLRLRKLGIIETVGTNRVIWNAEEKPLVLKIVIAGAFYPNYYTRCTNFDETAGVKTLGGLDPTKTVYMTGWPLNQPGPLYAKRIENYFQECVNERVAKIVVTFDTSSRIYIQFHKNESPDEIKRDENAMDEPGEISMSLYKAIKLRSICPALEIPLLDAETANERAEKLKLEMPALKVFMLKEDEAKERQKRGIRPILPGLDVSYMPLIIRRVVTPGHFWAQLRDEETIAKLKAIDVALNSKKLEPLNQNEKAPKLGSLVAAPRRKSDKICYLRAIVQNLVAEVQNEVLAKVLFVDNGHVDNIRVDDLRKINSDDEVASIPALAFECVLAEIRPSVMTNLTGHWSTSAEEEFHKLLRGDVSLFGEVYSVVNSVVSIRLIRVIGTEQLEINDYLVKQGYAEMKEEDYLSRSNHQLRQTYMNLPLRQREHFEDLQYVQDFSANLYPDPPDESECTNKVTLRGPFSPLEIGLASVTKAGLGKKTLIDISSVNSVALDTNPEDPNERLLVAGLASQSPSGHRLNLRNTTLMPNIPGLTSLLCLIFTPRMELRRSAMGSRYTGALCGLGYHPTTKVSMFPEHDLSIYFNVDITLDDLQDINKLRYWMNMGICVNPEGETDNFEPMALCQNRIGNALFRLLKKRRALVPRELDGHFDRWCRYPEELFIPPGKAITLKQAIFRLHYALDLEAKDDRKEELIAHMAELRVLATQHYRDNPIGEIVCKICEIPIFGVYQLRSHLNSREHRRNEQAIGPIPN